MHLLPLGRIRRATREHNALYEACDGSAMRQARQLTLQHIEETRDELPRSFSISRRARRRWPCAGEQPTELLPPALLTNWSPGE